MYLIHLAREVHAPALHAHDLCRNTDGGAVGRDIAQHDRICRNAAVVPYLQRAEHLCARADEDVIADGRVPLADVLARAAERDTVVYKAVVPDLGGLADDDAHAVVNDKALADLRAGVYLYPGAVPAALRDEPGKKLQPVHVAPVRAPVAEHRLYPRIKQQHLQ